MTKNESTLAFSAEMSKKPTESVAELAYVSTERYEPAGMLLRRPMRKLVNAWRAHEGSG